MQLSTETAEIELDPGTFLGTQRFEIVSFLGEGGMGTVYEAFDRELETMVALKVLQRVTPQSLLNFKQEFRSLADIRHPNLVTLGELHEEGGHLFFTMELIRGNRFAEHVKHWTSTSERRELDASARSTTRKFDTHIVDVSQSVIDLPVLPEDTTFDEPKLRDALHQLVLGISAIHDAGKVHRDIKPSNVMVSSQGRVVLLDFGLVSDCDAEADEENIVGTVPYMAPEQTRGQRVGPQADWYALGALIYQVLTGRPPFVGPVSEILRAKAALPPPRPRRLVPGVPADLDALCMALLEIDPDDRPESSEILTRLRADSPEVVSAPARPILDDQDPFVGRTAELQALSDAARRSEAGAASVVFIRGESGVGKSALVRRYCSGLSDERTLLLQGRCYERESVAYKAFDEIIDAVVRHLGTLDPAERSTFWSSHVGFVAQLFPVLRRLPEVDQLEVDEDIPPQERRSRAFTGIRDLIEALSRRYRVVLSIDDLQWTDHDSMALLAELLRPPRAPAVLLLATIRTAAEGMQGRTPEELLASLPCPAEQIEVGALPDDDARALVSLLSGGRGVDAQDLIEETGGHPLFIDAMLRFREANHRADSTLRLDDALRWRARTMEAGPRELLEMLCVAGMPLSRRSVAWATIRDPGVLGRWMGALAATNLIRTTGSGSEAMVEPFHDRVREAVSEGLGLEERRRWHLRLATALEATGGGTDGEILAFHRHQAGEVGRAIEHMLNAARAATEGLAFDRAVRLYQWCWEHEPAESSRRDELATLLGHALSRAGRGGEAARVFLDVAPRVGADERLELERLAAEQLLRSGHMEEGVEVLRRVVGSVGMNVPKTPVAALVEILAHRLYTKVRGLGFRERAEEDIDPELLKRIDIAWSASASLTMTDTILGVLFQERHFGCA